MCLAAPPARHRLDDGLPPGPDGGVADAADPGGPVDQGSDAAAARVPQRRYMIVLRYSVRGRGRSRRVVLGHVCLSSGVVGITASAGGLPESGADVEAGPQ